MQRFTTIQDVIDQAVVPSLGEYVEGHDVEAIAREAFEYHVDTDEAGNQRIDTAGFEQVADEDEYWQIVQRHSL